MLSACDRVRGSDSKERKRGFQPAKELNFVQERIEPAVGNAVMLVERLGMMQLVMRRFQDQPSALQPARERRNPFLMRPFVELVGGYSRGGYKRHTDDSKRKQAGFRE